MTLHPRSSWLLHPRTSPKRKVTLGRSPQVGRPTLLHMQVIPKCSEWTLLSFHWTYSPMDKRSSKAIPWSLSVLPNLMLTYLWNSRRRSKCQAESGWCWLLVLPLNQLCDLGAIYSTSFSLSFFICKMVLVTATSQDCNSLFIPDHP